jgi:hypothetical protein
LFSTTLPKILLSPTNVYRILVEVHSEKRVRFPIKCPLYLSVINKKLERRNRFLVKSRNVKFHENPFSWSRGVTYEETHRQTEDGRTETHGYVNRWILETIRKMV